MKKIKHLLFGLISTFVLLVAPVSMGQVFASPVTNVAATCTGGKLLTFPPWYKGLACNDGAVDVTTSNTGKDLGINGVWVIVLNVLNILLQISGYVSLSFIIWGGFKFIKSQGDPAKINEARDAIIKAIIGLVMSIGSVGLIQFIAGNVN